MRKLSVFGILFLVVSVIGLPAMAQTPDEETPANEGVCDELQADGTTKGLYGLCVAFCEAQDCEATFDEATGDVTFDESCRPSNPKLLTNYNKRKTAGDPPMPCVNVLANECPCWTESELHMVGLDAIGGTGTSICRSEPSALIRNSNNTEVATAQYRSADDLRCRFQARETTDHTIHRFLNITTEEYITCKNSIITECTDRGY